MLRHSTWRLAFALALTFCSAPLRADSKSANDAARAIAIGNAGLASFEQGRWLDALERFKTAEAHYHSPVFALYAARCLRKVNRLLEARDALRQLAGEPLTASAPVTWKRAQDEGRKELAELEAEIPSAVISVLGMSSKLVLLLDGRVVHADRRTELDPGDHRVIATDSGRTIVRDFVLAPSARERVVVRFAQLPVSHRGPIAGAPANDVAQRTSPAGWVLLGTGGVAIATGAVFGALALQRKSEVEDSLLAHCDGTICPISRRAEIEGRIAPARTLGTVADVLLIGGGGVALTGAGLLIFSATKGPAVHAAVSRRSAVVRFRF